MNPLVSVNMPVYNGEKYLRAAIESILNQTYSNFEFIIVNDGSTDKSVEIIQSYQDNRIQFIDNQINKGLSQVRNQAIEHSKGKYIAILDCDDIALPNRIERQVEFLEHHTDISILGSSTLIINELDEIKKSIPSIEKDEQIRATMLFQNCFTQSSMMLRKSDLPNTPYDIEYPPAEDYHLWIRIMKEHKVANLPDYLVKYRIHENNISAKRREEAHIAVQKILKEQLSWLNLSITEEEFGIIPCLVYKAYYSNFNFLSLANGLLKKILQQNNRYKLYKEKYLQQKIFELMNQPTQSYLIRKSYNFQVIRDLFKPSTQCYRYLTFLESVKIFIKSILRRNEKTI